MPSSEQPLARILLALGCLLPIGCDGGGDDGCAPGAKACKRDGETELAFATLAEGLPDGGVFENGQKYEAVRGKRTLTLGERTHALADSTGYAFETTFEAETDQSPVGLLSFRFNIKPWGVAELPSQVAYAAGGAIGPCVTVGDGYEEEHLSGSALRELDGALLIGTERGRLLGGGVVERAPNVELSEVELTWVDAGCPGFCGSETNPGDELWRSVALQLKVRGGDESFELLPGDHARFELDGQRYVFALEHAALPRPRPDDPLPSGVKLCGRAIWSLYREGVIIDLVKSGEAPSD